MRRSTLILALGAITALNFLMLRQREPAVEASVPPPVRADIVAAGPGLVEPVSEELHVSAQVGGRLDRVTADDGDRVRAGEVLAVIENGEYAARVRSADAELSLREAELRRVVNGARAQERKVAAAELAEAEAVLLNARAERERRHNLLRERVIARAEAEEADRVERVAEARVDAARQRVELINAEAREEDRARAESEVSLARARVAEARALYDKTFIRAPIHGIILRRHRKAGESVSTQFDTPIVTMADDSVRRVRVDVDEADVAGITVGQHAYVTADAFGDRQFRGRVVRISRILGRKNVRTEEPAERIDTKVLETLVQLEDGRELPLGLRVQAFILSNTSDRAPGNPEP
jgi:HlyD family secretion protein